MQELAHMIVVTDKSYNLLAATWIPKKTGGVVPGQTYRPENQGH